jgi:hypothetical protein
MIEKRRWPRVACQWEAVYSSIKRPEGLRSSATLDVSEGGTRFRTSAFVAVGERLRFTLRPPKGAALESVLVPVWVREIPTLDLFEVGGSFEDLSRDGREALRAWTDAKQAVLVTRVSEAVF